MGWHTLKRGSKGEKKLNQDLARVNGQNIISTSVNNDANSDMQNIETSLAKAMFDNLADAPDELSFRKGDIVTVIEQDVDGLIGWWLCLLHGKQGIVPGNRLKVIPPLELDQFEKETKEKKMGKLDGYTEDGSNLYDYLPTPTKATKTVPRPLSLKEMFDIPYKKSESSVREVYDFPKSQNNDSLIQKELYDVPRGEKDGELLKHMECLEIYDTPKVDNPEENEIYEIYNIPNNNSLIDGQDSKTYDASSRILSNVVQSDEIYDIPSKVKLNALFESQEIYDTPPNNSLIAPLPVDFYHTPRSKLVDTIDALEIYDAPSSLQNQKISFDQSSNMEIYDTGSKNKSFINCSLREIYDTPLKNNDNNNNYIINRNENIPTTYDSSRKPFASKDQTYFGGTPTNLDISKIMDEIYDSPFNADPLTSTIKRSPMSSITTTPRNSLNVSVKSSPISKQPPISQEIYDIPKAASNEYSNVGTENSISLPNTSEAGCESNVGDNYDIQKLHDEDRRIVFEEVYDIPISNSRLPIVSDCHSNLVAPKIPSPPLELVGKLNDLQEIYDIPTSALNCHVADPTLDSSIQEDELYDVPPSRLLATSDELYDVLPTRLQATCDEIYDIPASNSVLYEQEDVYDIPTNNTLKKNALKDFREQFINVEEPISEDLYDVPVNHTLKTVMSEVKTEYNLHRKSEGTGHSYFGTMQPAANEDYVDYHDVWANDPPRDLFQEHSKTIVDAHSSNHNIKPFSEEPKRSILDQINFDLVKELLLTTTEALERLRKLHLAVDTCVQTILSFWSDNWLDPKVLKTTIHSLRDYSCKLKTALRLLTEFGLSTLINCINCRNGESLVENLIVEVEPLLEAYYKIKICILHLDSNNWLVPESGHNEKFFATLNAIMILSDRIPDQCKSFNLSVQNKVHELFRSDPDMLASAPKSYLPYVQPSSNTSQSEAVTVQPETNTATLRRDLAGRRQQARESTTSRPVPLIPPKPVLPNDRRSLSGSMEPPESPRYNHRNRVFGQAERLVTDFDEEDIRQRKYASDPATPTAADKNKSMWSGSCPVLMDRHSASAHNALYGANNSIPEGIEVKQTNNERLSKNFPSDSHLGVPPMSPPLQTRSASLPSDDRLKNNITVDDGPPIISPLDHRDIESLDFFCRQVESQVVLLRESMKNLTEAVEKQEEPVVFVQHAKFISLTGHRVYHCGQDISERLMNTDIRAKLKEDTSHLTICIRGVVAATKTAALEYPNPSAMMEMISSVLALGDAVRIIYSVCRKALDS